MQSEESVGIPWQSIGWPIWPMWSHVKSIFRWRALWPFLAATWDSSILTWIRQAWEPEHLPGVRGPEIIGSRWREQDKLKTLGLIDLLVVKLMSIWDQAQERFYPQVFSWLCSCQLMLQSQSMDIVKLEIDMVVELTRKAFLEMLWELNLKTDRRKPLKFDA